MYRFINLSQHDPTGSLHSTPYIEIADRATGPLFVGSAPGLAPRVKAGLPAEMAP